MPVRIPQYRTTVRSVTVSRTAVFRKYGYGAEPYYCADPLTGLFTSLGLRVLLIAEGLLAAPVCRNRFSSSAVGTRPFSPSRGARADEGRLGSQIDYREYSASRRV